MNKLLNWSELSRYLARGDRSAIRPKLFNPKHWGKMDQWIYKDLPQWWEGFKSNYKK